MASKDYFGDKSTLIKDTFNNNNTNDEEKTRQNNINNNDDKIFTNVTQRLDKLQWSNWHTKTTIVLSIGWALDAFETSILVSILSLIKNDFGIESVTEASLITSSWLIGGMIGSLLFGWIGDRYGRKTTFIITLLMYSCFTVLTALSTTYHMFLVCRALTSIGVAGEYSAVTSSIAEFVPSKHRGKLSVLIQGTWGVGAILASAVNIPLVKLLPPNIAWRVACSLGMFAGCFTLCARRFLPESPRWLLSKNRVDEAEKVVQRIEDTCGQPNNGDNVRSIVFNPRESHNFFKQCYVLWRKYTLHILFACTLDLSQSFGGYGLSNFMTLAVLPKTVPDEDVPRFYTLSSLASFPGIAFAAILIDFIGRKKLLPLSYFLAAVSCYLIYPASLANSEVIITIAFSVFQMFYSASWGTGYSMYSEIFPTFIRSTGIGMAVCIGRLGGFFAPLITSHVFEAGGSQDISGGIWVVIGFFMVTVAAAVPWAIYGTEGKGRSLEDAALETRELEDLKMDDFVGGNHVNRSDFNQLPDDDEYIDHDEEVPVELNQLAVEEGEL